MKKFWFLMVSTASSVFNFSDFTTASREKEDFNVTAVNITLQVNQNEDSEHQILLDFVVLPLTAIVTFILLVGLIAFLIRKRRLDKLRHHLMPLYSFDPAEEGEDWEAELLEEGTDHQPMRKSSRPEQPQLSFRNNL